MSDSTGINEYENVSGGWIGVKIKDENRRTGYRGHAVPPNGRVTLTEEERVATANAPRKPEDNPFANGSLRLIAKDQETAQARPTGDGEVQEPAPPPEPPQEPQSVAGAPEKPEDQMTQAEIDEHNRKAAAARAIPAKQPPAAPPVTAGEDEAPKTPETVATPEAVAAAGKKPEGQRTATETVGTPDALKK